jgi:peroxiredoxin
VSERPAAGSSFRSLILLVLFVASCTTPTASGNGNGTNENGNGGSTGNTAQHPIGSDSSNPGLNSTLSLVLPRFPGPGQSDLSTLKGHVVLVDFWATWCAPCHDAATAFEKLFVQYGKQGLEVYGVSVDDDSDPVPSFLARQGVTYPILLDPSARQSSPRFSIDAIPTTLVVDRKGTVRFIHRGMNTGDLSQITNEVKQLLGEP